MRRFGPTLSIALVATVTWLISAPMAHAATEYLGPWDDPAIGGYAMGADSWVAVQFSVTSSATITCAT